MLECGAGCLGPRRRCGLGNVLLVIDVVRGFFEEGHQPHHAPGEALAAEHPSLEKHNLYMGEAARTLIEPIRRLIERELAAGTRLLYLCDNHDPDDLEFRMFPPHCIKGTPESEVIPELARYPGEVIPKRRYSSFYDTALARRLEELQPEKVIVCGVCTDICVMHTVAGARDRDYQVEVPAECVGTFDPEAHRFALAHMEKILGAKVVVAAPSH